MTGSELLTTAEMGRADAACHGAGRAGADADGERRPRRGRRGRRSWSPRAVPRSRSCAGPATMAATASSRHGSWRAGIPGRLCLLGTATALEGRCGHHGAMRLGRSEQEFCTHLADADLIIDALFGAGLSRPLDGAAAEVVAADQRARQAGRRRRCAERARRHHGGQRRPGRAGRHAPSRSSGASPVTCCCPAAHCAARSAVADIGIPASVLRE